MSLINKSKSSNTAVTNLTEANNVGASEGSIAAYNSTVNVLDGGAIGEAFGFGTAALDYAEAVTENAINSLSQSFGESTRVMSANAASVINKATLDSGERVQSTIKMVLWVVGIGIALVVWGKYK